MDAPFTGPIGDEKIIEYASWANESQDPIIYFTTTWTVPPPPASDDGQLIAIWPGLQTFGNAPVQHILQPVLQWGTWEAGAGNYWSITNAYATDVAEVSNGVLPGPGAGKRSLEAGVT